MCASGAEAHKVRAVLPHFAAEALVDAEQVSVGAIDAFSQGDADFGHGDVASVADGEEVFALAVMRATLERRVPLAEPVYAASHEDV